MSKKTLYVNSDRLWSHRRIMAFACTVALSAVVVVFSLPWVLGVGRPGIFAIVAFPLALVIGLWVSHDRRVPEGTGTFILVYPSAGLFFAANVIGITGGLFQYLHLLAFAFIAWSVLVVPTLILGFLTQGILDYLYGIPAVADGAFCGRCQYDLTGNVSGTCPECGTPIGREEASW